MILRHPAGRMSFIGATNDAPPVLLTSASTCIRKASIDFSDQGTYVLVLGDVGDNTQALRARTFNLRPRTR